MGIKKLKIKKSSGIKFLFILLMSLTCIKYGFQINFPQEVILIVALSIAVFGKGNDIIALCLCCIPLHTSFDYLYVILVACISLIIRNIKKIKIDLIVFLIFLILIWELLHSLVGDFSIKQIVSYMIPYLLVFTLNSYCIKKLDYEFIISMFSKSVIFTGITLFIRAVNTYSGSIVYAIGSMNRLGFVNESKNYDGIINPNSLGIICVLAIIGLLQNYFYGRRKNRDVIYTIILILLGAMTLSKTYIICLLISFVLFLLEKKDDIKSNFKLFMILFLIIITATIGMSIFFPTILESFIRRWQVEDLSTGRINIMKESASYIWSNLNIALFGIGLQNFSENAKKLVSIPPHDAFNEIIMAWGIPGLLFFSMFILSLILGAKKRNKNIRLVNYIPLIILIAKAFAGHWITSGYTMLAISFAYLSMRHDFTKKDN